MGSRVYLAHAPQRIPGAYGREESAAVFAVGVEVEDIDAICPVGVVAACDAAEQHIALHYLRLRPDVWSIRASVDAPIDGNVGPGCKSLEFVDGEKGIGAGAGCGDDDVHEALFYPCLDVVSDALAHFERAGNSCRNVERSPALVCEAICHFSDGALEIGEGVAELVAIVLVKMVAMALPVELDSIPLPLPTQFSGVFVPVLAHFGDCHIPRQGKPVGLGAVAEHPFGMFAAHTG